MVVGWVQWLLVVALAGGRTVEFTPRQRTWDLDVSVIPASEVDVATRALKAEAQSSTTASSTAAPETPEPPNLCMVEGCGGCGRERSKARLCPFGRQARP